METDRDDGFALRRVPLYGWAALGIIGWALYRQKFGIAIVAVASWAIVKALRGRL